MEVAKKTLLKWKSMLLVMIVLFIMYLGGLVFYQYHLLPRTTMAGVSVSELGPSQAQARVSQALNSRQITFKEGDQEFGQISLDKLGINVDIQALVEEKISQQPALAWPKYLFLSDKIPLAEDSISFDLTILEDLMTSLGIDNSQRPRSKDAYIKEDSDGNFYIQDEVYGQQISAQSLSRALQEQINDNQESMNLNQAYLKPALTKTSDPIVKEKNYLDKILASQITLAFDGHSITIDPNLINQWLSVNDQGQAWIDEEAIRYFVFDLNEQYAARFKDKTFNSTYQGQVTVPAGTFGWFIDADQEAPAIADALRQAEDVVREPIIVGPGYGLDPSEAIGNSYVEVDLTNQMMLIYREGQLVLDTPIVSGRIGTETTPGAYMIWNMEADSILRGYNPRLEEDYEIPVSYWIAFDYVGQGIHDATWLSSFGGNVYQSSGSLGCINTPLSVMGEVFSIVDYGWPVLVFH